MSLLLAVLALAPLAVPSSSERLVVVAFGGSRVDVEAIESALPRADVLDAGLAGDTPADARRRFERDVLHRAPDACALWFDADTPEQEEHLAYYARILEERGCLVVRVTPDADAHDAMTQVVEEIQRANLRPANPSSGVRGDVVEVVTGGEPRAVRYSGDAWERGDGYLVGTGRGNELLADVGVHGLDFRLRARLCLEKVDATAAACAVGFDSWFGFDSGGGGGKRFYTQGWLFGGGVRLYGPTEERIRSGEPFDLEIERVGRRVSFRVDGETVRSAIWAGPLERLGFAPHRARLRVYDFSVQGRTYALPEPAAPGYTIPVVDVSAEVDRQVVVDREPGQYLGHPTTVLLEDGKTMIAVYPKGHGKGAIVMKRSTDAGLTWSERLSVPENWAGSREVPTIHRVVDREGKKRLILFSGLYPVRMAVSEDDGLTWSPLSPVGEWGGIVAMGCVARVGDGDYVALFHDDGRFFVNSGERSGFRVYQTRSTDGGLTWSFPRVIAEHPHAHLCEPGIVRSPDGNQLCVFLRENSRRFNGFAIFSDDEAETWSEPRALPAALTGDRHTARYAPDGRLFVTFRDTTRESATWGDWVGWVGTYDDVVAGREGQYRVRLMDNKVRADCAYPGLELLPDGTFVTTTYGHWTEGEEPYVVSVRFKLEELDAKLR